MRRSLGWLCAAAAAASGAASGVASAQVGSTPASSPYRDLEYKQEWTLFGGWFNARHDVAGAGPQGGLFQGARWAIRLGGPAYFTARVATSFQERTVINPQVGDPERHATRETLPLMYADAGFDMQLTGFKSWHSIAPIISGGIGLAVDTKGNPDPAGFSFGSPFMMTFGAGFKYTPRGRWNVRVDWSNYLYRLHYPNSYYIKSGPADPVLTEDVKPDFWRRNNVYTIGITYLTFR
jgi:hypothetical protein